MVIGRRHTRKPPLGAQPSWGHPLVQGLVAGTLFNEAGGLAAMDFRRNVPCVISGSIQWVVNAQGPGIYYTDTTGSQPTHVSFGDSSLFVPTSAVTILLQHRKLEPLLYRNSMAFGVTSSNVNQRCLAHIPFTDGTAYFDFGGTTNGTTRVQAAGLVFGQDTWVFSVGARGMEIWQNGILRASNGATPTRTATSGIFVVGGAVNLEGNVVGADLSIDSLFLMYSRQLSAVEIQQLSSDPYCIMQPRRWTVPAIISTSSTVFRRQPYGLGTRAGSRQAL